MRRGLSFLVVAATLVPAAVTLAAVSTVPSSASALPAFEFSSAGKPLRVTAADLGVTHKDGALVVDDTLFAKAMHRLWKIFRQPPTAGTYVLKDGRIHMEPGTSGWQIDAVKTKAMLVRAIHGARSNLTLPMRSIPAPLPPGYAIVVKLQDFRLDLYTGPKVVKHFTVGTGALRFPTPPGAYYIRSKAMNPAWRNPGSRWARGMPSYIAPGPRNPLGTRAMRLDRGALVIHGTPQPWSVGHRSSHGCIRMRRADVESLYGIVPTGTPVFIVP